MASKRAVFVGYDPRLDLQYRVCRASIERHHPGMPVYPLKLDTLFRAGIVRRMISVDRKTGKMYDHLDGRPVSTEFTYTRFATHLVAELMGYEQALFCDSDFLFRAPVGNLFDLAAGEHPVWCVHHDYQPDETEKMDGRDQSVYPRKNWSSLMLFKVGHPELRRLSHSTLFSMEGRQLHAFEWLRPNVPAELPEEWNWLEGWSDHPEPKAVHYTRGTPDMPGHEDAPYAAEWWSYAAESAVPT